MIARPLRCPRCCSPAAVVERVTARLEWGPAVVGPDGVARPMDPDAQPPYVTAENAEGAPVPYGCCESADCRHQWRLRRRFDPSALPATFTNTTEGQS